MSHSQKHRNTQTRNLLCNSAIYCLILVFIHEVDGKQSTDIPVSKTEKYFIISTSLKLYGNEVVWINYNIYFLLKYFFW